MDIDQVKQQLPDFSKHQLREYKKPEMLNSKENMLGAIRLIMIETFILNASKPIIIPEFNTLGNSDFEVTNEKAQEVCRACLREIGDIFEMGFNAMFDKIVEYTKTIIEQYPSNDTSNPDPNHYARLRMEK